MKYLILLAVITLFTTCPKDKQGKIMNQDRLVTLEYSAISRGFFKEVKVTENTIKVLKNRNSENAGALECKKEDWSRLQEELNGIDLTTIKDLKAPTSKRLYDGAAIATLKITIDGEEFHSCSFDHGFPPKEIESIVNYILAMAQVVE
jgi:hypothetical protein